LPILNLLTLVLISQIGIEALLTGVGFSVVATIFYLIKTRVFKDEIKEVNVDTLLLNETEEPSADERKRMGRSFRIWLICAVSVAALAIILYLVAFFA
jgi:hypothetical protein